MQSSSNSGLKQFQKKIIDKITNTITVKDLYLLKLIAYKLYIKDYVHQLVSRSAYS